jgi:rhodanese-related sulfurtransferase
MGLNEFAGYFAVAGSALGTGWIAARYGLRPEPFYLGIGFVAVGLGLSALVVRETKHHAAYESKLRGELPPEGRPTQREVFWRTSMLDRNLSSATQAGLVNNVNDGMAWGLFPLFFAAAQMTIGQIGTLAAVYPATWGIAQLFTGAWSDRVGRKWLIAAGMWVQAVGIGVVIVFAGFATGAALLGVGTAMVYPTLLAAIGDVAHPSWRASSVGVYRLWRDLGYAIGALLAGVTADALGLSAAMWVIAALTFVSGLVVALRMTETLQRQPLSTVPARATCVEPTELETLGGQRRVLIVDVRSPAEFAAGHIDGAVNIPLDALEARATELPRDALVVTVCGKGGGRSAQAADQLRARGFTSARSLCGGTEAWLARAAQGA